MTSVAGRPEIWALGSAVTIEDQQGRNCVGVALLHDHELKGPIESFLEVVPKLFSAILGTLQLASERER